MGLRETAKGRCSNRPFFCALIQLSGNHNLIVQFCKGFFLFGFLNLVVNVHRGLNVRVSHDCHNQLDVVFHFTKARTECVSEVVNGKVSDNNRGTVDMKQAITPEVKAQCEALGKAMAEKLLAE